MSVEDLTRQVIRGKGVFIAPNATVIGNTTLGDDVSVWFGAVIRGDRDRIEIGYRSNVQDNAVIHVDPGYPTIIGHDCVIGHLALVHGATLGNHVMAGMHCVIMNGAVIGDESIIGANATVTAGTRIPPRSLVLGSPGKIIRTLSDEEVEAIHKNAETYIRLKERYMM